MLEALNLKNNTETRYRCQVSVYRTIGPLVVGRSAVRQGMEALGLLKKGAVGVPPNGIMNHREFLKHGGIRQAVADFKALQPDDIRAVMQPGQVIH